MQKSNGYPLSYFANTEPFTMLFEILSKQNRVCNQNACTEKEKKASQEKQNKCIPEWTQHVRLVTFEQNIINSKHKDYEFLFEFTTSKKVKFLLTEPAGTVAVFGSTEEHSDDDLQYNNVSGLSERSMSKKNIKNSLINRKVNRDTKPSPHLSLKFLLNGKNGAIKQIFIKGDLLFRLPRSLVKPVKKVNNYWVDSIQKNLLVKLGNSEITISRGKAPTLSNPIQLPDDTIVRIGGKALVAQIGGINLGGTAQKPKLQFTETQFIYEKTDN